MRNRSRLKELALSAGALAAIGALSLLGPKSASAQSSAAGPVPAHAAPELDPSSAAQGLVLVTGVLLLIRRYKRKD
jgi:hypothetical protein